MQCPTINRATHPMSGGEIREYAPLIRNELRDARRDIIPDTFPPAGFPSASGSWGFGIRTAERIIATAIDTAQRIPDLLPVTIGAGSQSVSPLLTQTRRAVDEVRKRAHDGLNSTRKAIETDSDHWKIQVEKLFGEFSRVALSESLAVVSSSGDLEPTERLAVAVREWATESYRTWSGSISRRDIIFDSIRDALVESRNLVSENAGPSFGNVGSTKRRNSGRILRGSRRVDFIRRRAYRRRNVGRRPPASAQPRNNPPFPRVNQVSHRKRLS